jgi:hypothetical protein
MGKGTASDLPPRANKNAGFSRRGRQRRHDCRSNCGRQPETHRAFAAIRHWSSVERTWLTANAAVYATMVM